jgi:hypothetical protein
MTYRDCSPVEVQAAPLNRCVIERLFLVARSGEILVDEETTVPVWFTVQRDGLEGHLSAERSEHFTALLKLFAGDESVILRELVTGWNATIAIWEPSKLPNFQPKLRFRVLELL